MLDPKLRPTSEGSLSRQYSDSGMSDIKYKMGTVDINFISVKQSSLLSDTAAFASEENSLIFLYHFRIYRTKNVTETKDLVHT